MEGAEPPIPRGKDAPPPFLVLPKITPPARRLSSCRATPPPLPVGLPRNTEDGKLTTFARFVLPESGIQSINYQLSTINFPVPPIRNPQSSSHPCACNRPHPDALHRPRHGRHFHPSHFPPHPHHHPQRRGSPRAEPEDEALPLAGGHAGRAGHLQGREPRAHRSGAGSHRPDLERALQAPHLRLAHHPHPGRQDRNHRRPVQDLHPQRHLPHHGAEAGLRAQRLRGQRGLCEAGRQARGLPEGRDAQPPQRHRTLRRREHRPGRRDPRHPRRGQGLEAHRFARRVLLWTARHRAGPDQGQGRDPSPGHHARRGARRARLRQPHGHPHHQRRDPVRRRLHLQPPGVLRHHGSDPDCRHRQGSEARPHPHCRGRPHRQGRAQGRDLLQRQPHHRQP